MAPNSGRHVVVIGAGISGLAVALRLASSGFSVDLYEKNAFAGGKVSAIRIGDYTWDIHPNQIIDTDELRKLFKACNKDINKYLKIKKNSGGTKYFFEDGKVMEDIYKSNQLSIDAKKIFNEPSRHITDYYSTSKQVYESIIKPLGLSSRADALKDVELLKDISKSPFQLVTRSLHIENKRRFARSNMHQIFDNLASHRGSDPNRTIAAVMYEAFLTQKSRNSTFKDGFHSLTSALCKLATDCGVIIHFEQKVSKITHSEGRVTGIVTSSGWEKAEYVISAIDISYLYREILPATKSVSRFALADRSLSSIVFCWGIRKKIAGLNERNIFFSADPKNERRLLWKKQEFSNDPTIVLDIQSRRHKKYAKSNGEAWAVHVTVPAIRGQKDWPEKLRTIALDKLSSHLKTNIETLIDHEVVLTPDDMEQQFGLNQGSLYGSVSHGFRATFLRHPNTSPDFDNLFFVGETVHPGPGLTLALHSAEAVAAKIRSNK